MAEPSIIAPEDFIVQGNESGVHVEAFDVSQDYAGPKDEAQADPFLPVPKPEPVGEPAPFLPVPKTKPIGEPAPFDVESYVSEYNKQRPKDIAGNNHDYFTNFFSRYARPFLAQTYGTGAALNRGMAAFAAHMDSVSNFVTVSTGTESGGLFEDAARIYSENAEYWQKRAEKVGINFFDEIISEAVGGFVPGIGTFAFDVASGLTFPYMDGAYQAHEKGKSPFAEGIVEAAKVGILDGIFKSISPLKRYLKAPVMGTVFGTQAAMEAPKGQKVKEFAKGAAIGVGYAYTSPGGQMGLNEVAAQIKPEIQRAVDFNKRLGERGQVEVYHGSPHKFDKFSTEKIGTGEGAQAFGWGLYFTDTESVAKHYSELGGTVIKDFKIKETPIIKNESPVDYYSRPVPGQSELVENLLLSEAELNKIYEAEGKKGFVKYVNTRIDDLIEGYELTGKDKTTIEKLRPKSEKDIVFELAETKHLYKATLHKGKEPGEYDYLEWDKPVQKDKFNNLMSKAKGVESVHGGITVDAILYDHYGGIGGKMPNGSDLYRALANSFGSDKEASLFLLRAGIDGIKYPAGTLSGGTKDNAFNYVVFDERAVTMGHPKTLQQLADALGLRVLGEPTDGLYYFNYGNATIAVAEKDLNREVLTQKIEQVKDYAEKVPVKSKKPEIKIHDEEVTGSHSGQMDLKIDATNEEGYVVGSVQYTEFQGEIYINMIEVTPEYQRQGIGTKLLEALQKTNPDTEINTGMVTEQGASLFKKAWTILLDERGMVGPNIGPPEKRKPRKFLKTIAEAERTDPTVSEAIKEIDPQDYLVQPNKESRAIAEARIDRDGIDNTIDWLKSNEPVSAEKGTTFITLMERSQKAGEFDREVELIEAYDQQLRDAGRFIQAASLWSNLSAPAFIRWSNKQLAAMEKKYSWVDTIFKNKPESFVLSKEEQQEIMAKFREINEMKDGIDKSDATLQMIDILAQKVPPSISEMIDAYRYQNMLSSPRSQMRNIGTNQFNTFFTIPVDITTRGAIDYVKAGLTGKERQAYVSDTPTYIKAAINAVPNAVAAFTNALKLGPGATISKPETGAEARTAFQKARVKQLPTALTLVTRFMEASDKFNMALIGAGEMARLMKQGMPETEAYSKAQEVAETYLYRAKLDPTDPKLSLPSKGLSSLAKMVKETRNLPGLKTLSKWYIPFVQTPSNVAIQMIERSPLGLIRGQFDSEVLVKQLSGAVFVALGAGFALDGKTTWSAPTDPDEKAWFYASGRKPFSVQIGNKHVPIWYLGPFALAFGIPMAARHYLKDSSAAISKDTSDRLLELTQGIAQFVGSQTSTQQVGALFSMMHGDIDYSMGNQTAFSATQILPASGLVRYINTIIDKTYRKSKGFVEGVEVGIPFLSQNLEAHMTPTGEESKRDAINYFLPWDIGTVKPEAEAMLPMARFNARNKKIESAMNKISKDLKEEKIDIPESLNRMQKLIEANTKSSVMFGEELLGEEAEVEETGQRVRISR